MLTMSVQYSVHNQEVDECIAILKSTRGRGVQSGADEKGGDDRESVAGNGSGDEWECVEDTTG